MANSKSNSGRRNVRQSVPRVTVSETINVGRRAPRRPGRSSRTRGLTGIEQGVGAYPNKPFGGNSPIRWTARSARRAMCALSPLHMPLPRSVGPYTPIRITRSFTTDRKSVLCGPVMHLGALGATGVWSTVVAMANNDAAGWSLPINGAGSGAAGNARLYKQDVDPTENGTMTPSSVTVQIMNGEALQTTTGVVEITRLRYMPDLASTAETWADYSSAAMALNPPRLCSAAKLAMRGVTTDLVPLNMNAMADFTRSDTAHGNVTANLSTEGIGFEGFSPVMVRNAGGVNLTYLVTIEYRTRFDPSNPACASHIHHKAVPEGIWDNLVSGMSKEGHGIVDIADAVAEAGEAVGGAVAAL